MVLRQAVQYARTMALSEREVRGAILKALGLMSAVAVGCADRGFDGGEDTAGEAGPSSTDDAGESSSGTTTGRPSSTVSSSTPPTATATATTDGDETGVPPPECLPATSGYEVYFCMQPSASTQWDLCVCDDECEQLTMAAWYEQNCCDSCDYKFSSVVCSEYWDGQCCHMGRVTEDWCGEGRPFLVDGNARLAEVTGGDTWGSDVVTKSIDVRDMRPALRDALAQSWLRAALAEHASVAAFARFVLQLMAVGAPAEMVEDATRAMHDEIEHARLCFALVQAYGGRPVAPGRLPIDDALTDSHDLEAVVRATFVEGCIGETLAAVEAALARHSAREPAVDAVLDRIAHDETAHACLAWRFVQWGLAREPSLAGALRDELARALEHVPSAPNDPTTPEIAAEMRAHGRLSADTLSSLRRRTLRATIEPCLDALLSAGAGRLPITANAVGTAARTT